MKELTYLWGEVSRDFGGYTYKTQSKISNKFRVDLLSMESVCEKLNIPPTNGYILPYTDETAFIIPTKTVEQIKEKTKEIINKNPAYIAQLIKNCFTEAENVPKYFKEQNAEKFLKSLVNFQADYLLLKKYFSPKIQEELFALNKIISNDKILTLMSSDITLKTFECWTNDATIKKYPFMKLFVKENGQAALDLVNEEMQKNKEKYEERLNKTKKEKQQILALLSEKLASEQYKKIKQLVEYLNQIQAIIELENFVVMTYLPQAKKIAVEKVELI